jgi:hypothetical protein
MAPCYGVEFFFVYGSRIKVFRDSSFYKDFDGQYFDWPKESPSLECLLYYIILSNFCMMFSAYFLTVTVDANELFVRRFHGRIHSPTQSPIWNFVFYIFKYLHSIVLLGLFWEGRKDIDRLHNLGFLLFLVVYTSYTWIYRRTSKLLTIFTAFFIFGNYYFSLK